MSDLAKRPSTQPIPAAPAMSNWLRQAMHDATNPHPDIGNSLADLPRAVRDEAARAKERLEAHLRPADPADWRRFLMPLGAVVQNPPTGENLERDMRALAFAMPDMPAAIFTTDRQREAIRRFKFWPRPAELSEWLAPAATAARAPLHGLRRIIEAKPAERPTQSPEERARISQGLRDLAAELKGRETTATDRPAINPRPLSDGALLESYRRQLAAAETAAKPAIETRIRALEQRIAAAAQRHGNEGKAA